MKSMRAYKGYRMNERGNPEPITWVRIVGIGELPLLELVNNLCAWDYLDFMSGRVERLSLSRLRNKEEVLKKIVKYKDREYNRSYELNVALTQIR